VRYHVSGKAVSAFSHLSSLVWPRDGNPGTKHSFQ
jgi:hypothetical protein